MHVWIDGWREGTEKKSYFFQLLVAHDRAAKNIDPELDQRCLTMQ
jgi:hypothetical protein